MQIDLDNLPQFTPPPQMEMPRIDLPKIDVEKGIADLTVKFEADKKKMVEDARTADLKSRFLPAFGLLFIGLGGLNVVRLTFLSKK